MFSGGAREISIAVRDGLLLLVTEHDRPEYHFFRQLVRFRFHHLRP